jgi:hypothetical protein
MQPKPFLAPVWLLSIACLFQCIFNLFFFRVEVQVAVYTPVVIFFMFLWPCVLFIQAFVYWRIRKRITERRWVWTHVGFLFFAFVVLRLVLTATLFITSYTGNLKSTIRLINKLDVLLFWSCVALGHIFLIIALVKNLSAKKNPPTDELFLDIPY